MNNKNHFPFLIVLSFFVLTLNTCFAQGFHGSVSTPSYPGGFSALKEFIKENINKTEIEGIPAVVLVTYFVNEQGKPEDIKVLKGINPEYDVEAIRVTNLLKWEPAVQWDKAVRVKMVMPVEFMVKNEQPKSVTITGNVTDKSTGKPVQGAFIFAKGTDAGAIADENGWYSILVPGENYELEFSSLGYGRRNEMIGKNRTINAELNIEDMVIEFETQK